MLLTRLAQKAQDHWPEFSVVLPDFIEYIGSRIQSPESSELGEEDFAAEDLYLAFACLQGNTKAQEIFLKMLSEQASDVSARLNLEQSQRPDYLQQAQEDLLFTREPRRPLLAQYRGEGRLNAWLKVVLFRRFLRLKKSDQQNIPLEDVAFHCMSLEQTDEELRYIKTFYVVEFKKVFSQAVKELSPQERNLLRYYIVDGLNIDQIGAIYDVHRATVARWLSRIRDLLQKRTKRLLRDCSGVDIEEFDSVIRLIQSRLNITFSDALSQSAPNVMVG